MRRYALLAAALMVLTSAIAWSLAQPRPLFARVASAMSRAQGFRCDLTEVPRDGSPAVDQVSWSPTGAERLDLLSKKGGGMIAIFRPGEPGLSLEPDNKQYQVIPASAPREFSFGLFARLGEFRGEARPIPVPDDLRGAKVEGFVVPWAAAVGDDTHPDATIRVWLDPATHLPVRVDLLGLGPHGAPTLRLENFRWGPQDPRLFDTSIPPGYTKRPSLDADADEITRDVTYGLSTFAKYNNGRYPAVKYVYGDEQREALRKLMGMGHDALGCVRPDKERKWADPKAKEFAYGSHGLSWINSIQRDFPDSLYNGKTVTPRDGSRVLLRWGLEDGTYRVIFGDLRSATVSPDRLRQIESR